MSSWDDIGRLVLAGSGAALATGLGAVPVFLLGGRAAQLRPLLLGLAIGLMGVASVVGLLRPALRDGDRRDVAVGLALGVGFLLASRRLLRGRDVHVGQLRGAGVRQSVLVFAVLFVHSLPEGLAIGTAYASATVGLGVFVLAAIALQNVPEGAAVAIPMQASGFGRAAQFWAAVLTSAPQPLGAVLAFLLVQRATAALPLSFAFAAGTMLALAALEMAPEAFTRATWRAAAGGMAVGAAAMLVLSAVLAV
jgi:ZIP family zinc transporter